MAYIHHSPRDPSRMSITTAARSLIDHDLFPCFMVR